MSQLAAARRAREKVRRQLKVLEDKGRLSLAGIGIGKTTEGLCVRVLLNEAAHDEKELPRSVDGINVEYRIVTKVRAY